MQEWHSVKDTVIKDQQSEATENTYQGQGCAKDPERIDIQKETLSETGMQQ
jgi:hypothetical protein